MKKQIMTLALLGLLAGCSSALTALHYYSLDAEALPAAAVTGAPPHQPRLGPRWGFGALVRGSLVF